MKFQEKILEVSYKSVVIIRIMLSLIFIIASTSHFFNIEKTVTRIENSSMGFMGNILGTPETAVILSGIVMLIAGIYYFLGSKPK